MSAPKDELARLKSIAFERDKDTVRLTRDVDKLKAANAKAVARATELKTENESLRAKVEWLKTRCAELEAKTKAGGT